MNAKQKKMQGSVILSVDVSVQFCEDVMTAAAYACNYWAHGCDIPHIPEGGFGIEEDEISSGETRKVFAVTRTAILLGIRKILEPSFNVRSDIRETLFGALAEDDASNVDEEIADIIVQAAMFGEIVYG